MYSIRDCEKMNRLIHVRLRAKMATDSYFSYIADDHSRIMMTNAYNASESLGLGDWFRTWEPEPDRGYMFSSHPNIGKLSAALESDGHSGASFGWVCRNLQSYYRDPVAFARLWVSKKEC